jgi:hypothetical protein
MSKQADGVELESSSNLVDGVSDREKMTPWDEGVEWEIVPSETPVDVDGYKIGEPKYLRCAACEVDVLLTEEPSAGVDDIPHDPACPQRWAKSDWWRDHLR